MKKYEKSEIHMFYVKIFEEKNDFEKAIDYLKKNKKEIVDLISYNEKLYQLY